MSFIPPSIFDIGLQNHLDQNHIDKGGYTEFIKRVELKEPKAVIARAFAVDKRTINKWLEVYDKEAEHAKAK